jgi:hypothetical protein
MTKKVREALKQLRGEGYMIRLKSSYHSLWEYEKGLKIKNDSGKTVYLLAIFIEDETDE